MEESCGVIPLRKTKEGWQVFLVCLKSGFHWGFPKGHKEEGETERKAALRELKEETALEVVSFLQEKPFVEEYSFEQKGREVKKRVVYFLALVEGEIAIQKKEIIEGGWFFISQAFLQLTYASAREILKEVEKILSKI